MDYRYDKNENSSDFHRNRKAFIILNNTLEFLPVGEDMTHYEYCKSKGISKDKFNEIIRGYYLNNYVVFYKDNFIYDEEVINISLNYLEEISLKFSVIEFDVYFGQLPDDDFKLDYYYGRYNKGIIIRN